MNFWIFTTKNVEEYKKLVENDSIKMAGPVGVKTGDIILIYRHDNYDNIKYIFEAQKNAYKDKNFIDDWDTAVDLTSKIVLEKPINLKEINENSFLKKSYAVKENFKGYFFDITEEEWNHFKNLILYKNPELEYKIDQFRHKKWFFVIQEYFYDKLKNKDEIVWNSPSNIKKDDIIFVYTGKKSDIGFILSAMENPAVSEDPKELTVKVLKEKKIPKSVSLQQIKNNKILRNSTAVKMGFRGSHFMISQMEYEELKKLILQKNSELTETFNKLEKTQEIPKPFKIILTLFNEFKEKYLKINEGLEHTDKYELERQKVLHYYELIKNDNQSIYNVEDPPINHLLPIKEPSVAPAAVGDIRAFKHKDEDLPGLTEAVVKLIDSLKESESNEDRQILISTFKQGKYRKGFQNAMLTPTLYYIDPEFWFINKKTVTTFDLLSELIGDNKNLSGFLDEYIDSNDKLHDLVKKIQKYIPNLDFELFDAFCHWMCSENLGNYANDNEKFKKWLIDHNFEQPEIEIESAATELFLKPKDIETKLRLDLNLFDQVCGTLNSKKHIMLTGAPGTGKTDFAEAICKSVKENNFSDGYVLTTATSDWTTYDTIGGYMPSNDGKSLKFEEGKFLQAIKENKWLIIDEINRADIDKAFGQLFTVLSGQDVELPFKDGDKPIKIERIDENRSYYDPDTATYNVGNNWRIIATMNIFDKDYLFEMSYAFMRRFTFIYINLPETEDYQYLIHDDWGINVSKNYLNSIESLLDINEYRPIGPAIFKDMVEYVHERHKISNPEDEGYEEQIIKDTIVSFILPQFEGLELHKIDAVWNNVLYNFDVNDELKARLEEISGTSLKKKSKEEKDEEQ